MDNTDFQLAQLDIMLLKLGLAAVFIVGPSLYLNGCEEKRQIANDTRDIKWRIEKLENKKNP